METITIKILQDDVYDEVAKATDYTGSKLLDEDAKARNRILATDANLTDLERMWEETALSVNENFKELLVSGMTTEIQQSGSKTTTGYEAVLEVSKSFDKTLTASVESTLRSFFIASIIGQWFKFANKGEAKDYIVQAATMIEAVERLLYSRRKPTRPTD